MNVLIQNRNHSFRKYVDQVFEESRSKKRRSSEENDELFFFKGKDLCISNRNNIGSGETSQEKTKLTKKDTLGQSGKNNRIVTFLFFQDLTVTLNDVVKVIISGVLFENDLTIRIRANGRTRVQDLPAMNGQVERRGEWFDAADTSPQDSRAFLLLCKAENQLTAVLVCFQVKKLVFLWFSFDGQLVLVVFETCDVGNLNNYLCFLLKNFAKEANKVLGDIQCSRKVEHVLVKARKRL